MHQNENGSGIYSLKIVCFSGTTEAIACIETAMEHIAYECNLDPAQVRLNNLDSNGSLHKIFPEFLKETGKMTEKSTAMPFIFH